MTTNNDVIEAAVTRTGDLLLVAVNDRIRALNHALAEMADDEPGRLMTERLRDEYVEIQSGVRGIVKAAAAAQFIESTVLANYCDGVTSPFVVRAFYGDDGVGCIEVETPGDVLIGTTLYDAIKGYEA